MVGRRVRVEGALFTPRIGDIDIRQGLPDNTVYVGRERPYLKRSPFHNPYTVAEYGREKAIALYREHLARNPDLVERARTELAGEDLACSCPLDEACHVDTLLEILNGEA